MSHASSQFDEKTLARLASHYGRQSTDNSSWGAELVLVRQGRVLASAESEDSDIPACRACHGPWPEALNREFPSLGGAVSKFSH